VCIKAPDTILGTLLIFSTITLCADLKTSASRSMLSISLGREREEGKRHRKVLRPPWKKSVPLRFPSLPFCKMSIFIELEELSTRWIAQRAAFLASLQ
jgi:hypothetical protein